MPKRKLGHRYPNGELRHPRKVERLETERDIRAPVMAQPHRRGAEKPTDQKHECPLGKYALRHKLHDDLFLAGQKYRELVLRWRAANSLPTPANRVEDTGGREHGAGPSRRTVGGWAAKIAKVEKEIRKAGIPFWPVHDFIVDERDHIGRGEWAQMTDALGLIAVEMGYGRWHHPFANDKAAPVAQSAVKP